MKLLLSMALLASLASAQEPKRPRITGVAHVAIFAADIDKSRAFYKDFLGYGEPFDLKNPDGSLSLTFIKINDRQYIEVFPEKEKGSDRIGSDRIASITSPSKLTTLMVCARTWPPRE